MVNLKPYRAFSGEASRDGVPKAMKIVVMSDTHLDRPTGEFETICARFCEGADMVIHLGDWDRVGTLNYLEQYPLEAVCGNMDDTAIRQRLPAQRIVKAGAFRLGITHGWGAPGGIRQRIAEQLSGVDAILFGHTHQPLIARENGVFWFNPGSVFLGRGKLGNSIGLLKIDDTIEGEIITL